LYTEIKNGKFISNSQVLNDKKNEYKKLYEKIDKINTVVNNVEVCIKIRNKKLLNTK